VEACQLAERFIDAILSFCGHNLEVANWHLNGDTEPFDNFITENQIGDRDELETLRAALAKAGVASLRARAASEASS
jgi:hypothetical protein